MSTVPHRILTLIAIGTVELAAYRASVQRLFHRQPHSIGAFRVIQNVTQQGTMAVTLTTLCVLLVLDSRQSR